MSTRKMQDHNIPESFITVTVRIIDNSTISDVHTSSLFDPPLPGLAVLPPCPSFSFLIEHASREKLLYDLGVPKDRSILGKQVNDRLATSSHRVDVTKDIVDLLSDHGIGSREINAVIWSHTHWDHKGDTASFPNTTELIVGPGSSEAFIHGAGNSHLGGIEPREIKGRRVRELDFTGSNSLHIGHFKAIDYLSDGSFYLLDSPGHSVGHLCALARTTSSPSTFMFLGGDAAHHCAELRPSASLPMPESISPNPLTLAVHPPFCPGAWFADYNVCQKRDPKGPITQPSFGHDIGVALQTIEHMQELDGCDDVLVVLAHDSTIRDSKIPFFPEPANGWKEVGVGNDVRWAWVRQIKEALSASGHSAL